MLQRFEVSVLWQGIPATSTMSPCRSTSNYCQSPVDLECSVQFWATQHRRDTEVLERAQQRKGAKMELGSVHGCRVPVQKAVGTGWSAWGSPWASEALLCCVGTWALAQVAQRLRILFLGDLQKPPECGRGPSALRFSAAEGVGPDGPRDPCQPQPFCESVMLIFILLPKYTSSAEWDGISMWSRCDQYYVANIEINIQL